MQPGFHQFGPASNWKFGATQTVSVASLRVEMKLGRDFGIFQREEIDDGIFHVYRVIFCLKNKRWWSLIGDVDLRVRRKILLSERQIARIDDHGEVGTTSLLIGC